MIFRYLKYCTEFCILGTTIYISAINYDNGQTIMPPQIVPDPQLVKNYMAINAAASISNGIYRGISFPYTWYLWTTYPAEKMAITHPLYNAKISIYYGANDYVKYHGSNKYTTAYNYYSRSAEKPSGTIAVEYDGWFPGSLSKSSYLFQIKPSGE